MQWIRNIGLGYKITLILIVFFAILLASVISILVFNTENLTQEVATDNVTQELDTLTSRLFEIQNNLESDIEYLIADITFFQAVGRRSQEDLEQIIGRTELSSEIYDVEIIDGDGNFIINTNPQPGDATNSTVLDVNNESVLGSSFQVDDNGEQVQINIVSSSPILSITRNFLGAIQVKRQIDDALLQDITAQRDDVIVGLIYNNELVARNNASEIDDTSLLVTDIALDESAINRAENGETVIVEDLLLSDNIPFKAAYAPISEDDDIPVTLLVLIELSNLNAFQTETLNNTILVFIGITAGIILMLFFALRFLAINPITKMRTSAQKMAEGDYDQRIPVSGRDELGQLAETYNEMVATIQERETSLEEARAEAERANHVKSAFLASMSHELRTPLNAIINFSGFVADGDVGPVNKEQEEILGDVVQSARHLLSLINDVLDMSKIEAGSLPLIISDDLNVNAIIETILPTARTLLNDKPVALETDLGENIPQISGDRQRITQILLNLISNACKFTDNGSIVISTERMNGNIKVAVKDSGPGISESDLDNIFQAFVQTDTGVRQGGGTGLGLPITKSLVEAHHGKIWVESELGKGAIFYVVLPVK